MMKKRILSLALSALLVLGTLPAYAAPTLEAAEANTETALEDAAAALNEDGVFVIDSPDDWDTLVRDHRSIGTVELMIDIDASTAKTVGTDSAPFVGTFHGNGHTVYLGTGNTGGVFGFIRNAEIDDLTVRGGSIGNKARAGGIADCTDGTCVIRNCHVKDTDFNRDINSINAVGGIVGSAIGSIVIENCTVSGGLISCLVAYGSAYCRGIGGIVGSITGDAVIRNCRNSDDIHVTAEKGATKPMFYAVGGIAGLSEGNLIVEDCANCGSITSEHEYNPFVVSYTGGIVGYCYDNYSDYSAVIDRCVNSGTIKGGNIVGGIVGCSSYPFSPVINCVNRGDFGASDESVMAVGGIVGQSFDGAINCLNTGCIGTGTNTIEAGGIIGSLWAMDDHVRLMNCYSGGSFDPVDPMFGSVAGSFDNVVAISSCYYADNGVMGGVGGGYEEAGISPAPDSASELVSLLNAQVTANASANFGTDDHPVSLYYWMADDALTAAPYATITFANGEYPARNVPLGSYLAMPEQSDEEDALYECWFTDEDCTVKYDFDTPVRCDTTIYVDMLPYMTVSFSGSDFPNQRIPYSYTASNPGDPSDEYAVFDGWCADEDGTTAFNFDHSICADTVIYAKWLPQYVVTFDYDGYGENTTQTLFVGTKPEFPALPSVCLLSFAWDNDFSTAYGKGDHVTVKAARTPSPLFHTAFLEQKSMELLNGDTVYYYECPDCGHLYEDAAGEKPIADLDAFAYGTYIGLDEDGALTDMIIPATAQILTASSEWSEGVYKQCEDEMTVSERVTVSGDVLLILMNGTKLICEQGIEVSDGAVLTICAQTDDETLMGQLEATGIIGYAAIGAGEGKTGGTVTVCGGKITAAATERAAGIGSGYDHSDCTVYIYGGVTEASSVKMASGIGSGDYYSDCTVTIGGGKVSASSSTKGTGIGSGNRNSKCTVTIDGGIITASGADNCAGIGSSGDTGGGCTIIINGGDITAYSADHKLCMAIGKGYLGSASVTCNRTVPFHMMAGDNAEEARVWAAVNIGITYFKYIHLRALGTDSVRVVPRTSIRTSGTPGLRFAAYVDNGVREKCDAYGFLVAREVYEPASYAMYLVFDEKGSAAGMNEDGYSYTSGEAYNKAKGTDLIYATDGSMFGLDNTDATFFTGVVQGIPSTYYTERLVARPYIIIDGVTLYGETYAKSLYENACAIRDADYAGLDDNGIAYIDSILSTVES